MKFDLSARRPQIQRDREPGSLLGEKRICCSRCDVEFPENELSTIPPDAGPGRPRIYVCRHCR